MQIVKVPACVNLAHLHYYSRVITTWDILFIVGKSFKYSDVRWMKLTHFLVSYLDVSSVLFKTIKHRKNNVQVIRFQGR